MAGVEGLPQFSSSASIRSTPSLELVFDIKASSLLRTWGFKVDNLDYVHATWEYFPYPSCKYMPAL